MKLIKALITKKPNKDLFDNPFINFKEWNSAEDNVYDDLSSSIGEIGYHSDSFVKDDEDYTRW